MAGTVRGGFLQRLVAAFSAGDSGATRRMPPDHPLSRYFMATLDQRDEQIVTQLVSDARLLKERGT